MSCVRCLCLAIIILLVMCTIHCITDDGFRSDREKMDIARDIIKHGKPQYSTFKRNGLDGVEYYDAKQLWKRDKYNVNNIVDIL